MTSNLLILFPDAQLNAKAIRTSRTRQDRFDQLFDFFPWSNTLSGPKYALHKLPAVQNSDLVAEYDMGSGKTKAVDFVALGRADYLVPANVVSFSLKGTTNSQGEVKDVGRRNGALYWWSGDENISRDTGTGELETWADKISGVELAPSGAAPLVTRADNRCNFALYSGNLINVTWVLGNATRAAYSGITGAITLTENGATSDHDIAQTVAYLNKGMRYRASIYALSAGRDIAIKLSGNCFNYGTAPKARFNLSSGTVYSTAGGGSPSATITAIGGGIYRCTLEATANTTADDTALVSYQLDNGAGTNYLGNSTSGCIIYSPQFHRDIDDSTYIEADRFPQISGINGKRALYFHNHGGAGCPIVATPTTVGDYTTEFSIYSVIQSEVVTGADYEIYRKAGGGTASGYREYIRSADLKRVFQDTSGTVVSTNAITLDSIDECFVDRGAGTGTLTFRKNQSGDGSGALAAPTSGAAAFQIGGPSSAPFRGKIGSITIIDQELSSTDGGIIGLYLLESYRETTNNYKIADLRSALAVANLEGTALATDYKATFTALPAYRYWTSILGAEINAPSIFPISKLFFGTAFDFGVDCIASEIKRLVTEAPGFRSSSGMVTQQRGDYLRYSFSLIFEGVTDDKVRDFSAQVATFHSRLNCFLATVTDHAPLENQRLVYCTLVQWKAENKDDIIDRNTVELVFNEVW